MSRPAFSKSVRIAVVLGSLVLLKMPLAAAQSAQFVPLGFLPGGSYSHAYGLSADGSVLAGDCVIPGAGQAIRWTAGGGMQNLGHLTGQPTALATGVSPNGLMIVGATSPALGRAFKWTAATGMQALPVPGDSAGSFAHAVSADGAVIVGEEYPAGGDVQAVRWVSGTLLDMGDLPGGDAYSSAHDVTPDGAVIVGYGASASGREAFRWTAAGGMQGLGDLPGGPFDSLAFCVSADGSVVGGSAFSSTGPEAFRWTATGGMQGLGRLPGMEASDCAGITADGAVMVGGCIGATRAAFIWSESTGMLDLRVHLLSLGATGLNGWKLGEASAISGDGRVVCGWGYNPSDQVEAWLAIIPPLSGCASEPCDANCDGSVNQFDIVPFVEALSGEALPCSACAGDANEDGSLNQFDIAGFVACLFGP